MLFPPFIAQDRAVSWAILSNKGSKPLFPHWLMYATTGLTLTFYPALGVHCVHHDVVAWNGALGFWLGAAGFGIQVGLLVSFLMKVVGRPDEDDLLRVVDLCENTCVLGALTACIYPVYGISHYG